MDLAARILVSLVTLALLGLGLRTLFTPRAMLDNFAVDPRGAAGLNTIRGVIGGLFLAAVAMLLTGLLTGQGPWLLAVAMLLGAVAVGRVVGLVADGPTKAVVPPLIVEVVMVGVLVGAHVQLAAAG